MTCQDTGRSRREREGGFALLLVFLMAAVIGITLYMEMPRLAFQSQRQKEQLLMERGEQYQIAIRRYMQRGLKQGMNQMAGPSWPSKIEDLESTNGRRFLRKRYIDPMTGKDEWRLIHINNGILTDSVNNKPQNNNTQQASQAGVGISEVGGLVQAPGQQGANLALTRRRASDNASPGDGGSGDPNQPGNSGATVPPAGPAPPGGIAASGLPPGVPVPGAPGQPGQPVQPNPGVPPPPPPGNTSASSSGAGGFGTTSSFGSSAPSVPTGSQPGQIPGVPGAPVNSNNPGGSPYGVIQGANGTAPGFPQPGTATNGQMSPATLLNNLLTQPRPGGMPTVSGAAGTTGAIGGGIAGFASTVDADSIMVCADHSNYKEWEFIFDPTKWKAPANPNTKLGGTPVGQPAGSPIGSPIGQQIGTPIGSPVGGATTGSGSTAPGAAFSGTGSGAGPGSGPGSATTPGPGTNPGSPGQAPGAANQGGMTTCGMEARPGIR